MKSFFFRPGAMPLLLALVTSSLQATAQPDIRVLVDVSGSMKTTDPDNLRIPALKLLAELLPAGATAGVWLFDQGVTPLLLPGTVTPDWKKRARAGAGKIHSRGLFTNIEAALASASRDWQAGAIDGDRHVVLLTDGKVDVSRDPAQSADSRARVLGSQLAELKAKGARVHAIALSADVDSELLDSLASGTDGWRENAPTAAALQRAFLHIFEQAANPDTLPLSGNSFVVDASVSEVTLLVFRAAGAPPLVLKDPAAREFTANTATGAIRWQSDAGYELITLVKPAPGTWTFSGEGDPDNRAMVVTDLSLEVAEIPSHLMPGQQLELSAGLKERGQPIERVDFLKIVTTGAAFTNDAGTGDVLEMPLDAGTHRYTASAQPKLVPGTYELTVRARSGTFEREKRQRVQVHDTPLTYTASATRGTPDAPPRLQLEWKVEPSLVKADSVTGYVLIEGPAGYRDARALSSSEEGPLPLDLELPGGGQYDISPTAIMDNASGQSMALHLTPRTLAVDGPPSATPAPAPAPAAPSAAPPPPEIRFGRVALLVLAGNLLLALLIGPLWLKTRQREMPSKGVSL